jgi:hypothetical protein
MTHRTEPVTVEIDRQYKGDVSFRVLPLKGMGAILGMPWLHRHGALVDHQDKTVKFHHRGRDVVLLPRNPVYPPPPLEPLVSGAAWISEPKNLPSKEAGSTSRPSRLSTPPSRKTHIPGPKELAPLVKEMKSALKKAKEEFELAQLSGDGNTNTPSSRTLSSFNMYWNVEVNSAARFERHVASLSEDEALDTSVLYVRGSCEDDIELSDRPFSVLPSSETLASVVAEELPLWSLAASQASTPMPTLPNKPTLSLPAYLDKIQPTLDDFDPGLRARFEKTLSPFAADVFPDPPCLKLGPKRPEDLVITELPGSQPVWKKVY